MINDTFIGELKYLKFQHFEFQETKLLLTWKFASKSKRNNAISFFKIFPSLSNRSIFVGKVARFYAAYPRAFEFHILEFHNFDKLKLKGQPLGFAETNEARVSTSVCFSSLVIYFIEIKLRSIWGTSWHKSC
jgi:hypothetical protein